MNTLLQALNDTLASALPPLNSPLNGVTTIDHGCDVPSQTMAVKPKPLIVAMRPTVCLRSAKADAFEPEEHDAVPLTVALPDFEKLPEPSTVTFRFGASTSLIESC